MLIVYVFFKNGLLSAIQGQASASINETYVRLSIEEKHVFFSYIILLVVDRNVSQLTIN